ncbi:NADPH:quinone reductase [Tateyamaria omphalii]|uniref:Zinc-binding dehydrogenase n=1 Tax=Tateyamaria omphalii TaxID=299262 RepID=A0A1P8MWT5_9RHOB|nr:NADPH:quinone reductase [Tateyamaria omphalii]APX12468.1 zinc-binding dehydrogenase [Tateyamaria omphalii]
MKCIQYSRFGPAADVLTLAELPTPDPAAGEVLVELSYSGVNPSDVKARGGTRPGATKPPFDQIVPHSDGAGRIVAIGDGVPADRIGQRVWIWNGQWQRPFGTAATHICLPSDQAVDLPDGVSEQTGAVLGIPGLTAAQAVFGGGAVAGQTVLVQGGAGTVGLLAVQLAKWGGARVIATAHGAGMERAEAAGADAVLDYTAPDLGEAILNANEGAPVERIVEVELGQNIDTDAQVIAPNGSIAVYGSARNMTPTLPFGPLLFKAVTLDVLLIYLLPKAERDAAIAYLHDALSEGALTCPIAQVFPLARTAAAHEAVERGGRDGAVLVEVQA